DDEEELEHFIVYCTCQSAEISIDHHNPRSEPYGNIEVPAEDYLQQHRKSVERDARREDRHHSESERVEGSCLLIESKLEVFGYTSGSASVIERHHVNAKEDHRECSAEPIEVRGVKSVLRSVRGHAEDFLRAEVGGNEGKARDPEWNVAIAHQEVVAGLDLLLQQKANADHEHEIDRNYEIVD